MRRNHSLRFSPSHIKRMMQVDEDIGKVAHAVPAMVARAVEMFSTVLVQRAGEITKQRGAKTMTSEHMSVVIREDPKFDFLIDLVEGIGESRERPICEKTSKTVIKASATKYEVDDNNHDDKSAKVKKSKSGKSSHSSKPCNDSYQLNLRISAVDGSTVPTSSAIELAVVRGAQGVELDEYYD